MRAAARRQRGAALIALVAIFLLGGLWWLLAALTPVSRASIEATHNTKLLKEAKLAVLGWVAQNAADTTDWNPGKLPCPEALGSFSNPPGANEGVRSGFCAGAATAVGRVPWKSLGIDKPVDASGEVLWYVVSPGWKKPNNATPELPLGLNSNSAGGLTVDGQPNAAVAAIIAPGRRIVTNPIASQTAQGCSARTQTRTTFPPANSNDYLECQNIAGASLRTGAADNATNEAINDQVILITAAEVMAAIEGVIAKRIENTVVPQLTAMYASATWGASAADPIFPFPASFGDPSASNYRGASANTEGLLPLTSNCVTVGDARCEQGAPFVTWDTTGPTSITKTAGTALITAANCAAATSTITCTISYALTCAGIFGSCDASLSVSVTGRALNVGMAMRTLSTAVATGMTPTGITAPISSAAPVGSASMDLRGNLASASCIYFFGSCTASVNNATVTVPIGIFADHVLANPATTDNVYWFTANKWHQVTYYAVSPSHVPSGAHNCSTALPSPNCITINVAADGSTQSNRKAVLILAGRSINAATQPRPGAVVTNYLEGQNSNLARTAFAQNRIDRITFNDRVVSVANYP